jgi:hypothetical protein
MKHQKPNLINASQNALNRFNRAVTEKRQFFHSNRAIILDVFLKYKLQADLKLATVLRGWVVN